MDWGDARAENTRTPGLADDISEDGPGYYRQITMNRWGEEEEALGKKGRSK